MIGKIIGNYEITSELAQGGMGAVYRGKHLSLPREVVIKSILLSGFSHSTQDLLKARFLREACIHSQLDHPNVVRVYEFFVAAENYYLVMEYVAGMSLGDLLKRQGQLAPEQAIQLFRQALAGMAYAHDFTYLDESGASHTGIVHRDIKPGNMLLDGQARLKLTDFGIVKTAGEHELTQSGFNPGTVAYMSPEQLRGLSVDARSDIYSLGVTFYEMLTGRLPFEASGTGSDYEIRKGHIELEPPPITDYCPNVPAELQDIVLKSLRKDPAERFQTATEFLKATLEFAEKSAAGELNAGNPMLATARQTVVVNTRPARPAQPTSDATLPRTPQKPAPQGQPIRVNVPLEPTSFRRTAPEPQSHRGKFIAGVALLLVLAAAAIPFFPRRSQPTQPVAGNTGQSEANTVSPGTGTAPALNVTPPVAATSQQTTPDLPVAQNSAQSAQPEPVPSPSAENAMPDDSAARTAQLNQAREQEQQGQYREAIATYENYLRNYAAAANAGVIADHLRQLKQFYAVLTVAGQEYSQQDYDAAERDYKQALLLKPDSRRAKQGYEESRSQAELARRYGSGSSSTGTSQPQQGPPPMQGPMPPPPGQGPMPPPPGRGQMPPPRRP